MSWYSPRRVLQGLLLVVILGGAGVLASSAASPAISWPHPTPAAEQAVRDVCALVEAVDAPSSAAPESIFAAFKWKHRALGAGSSPAIAAGAAGEPHVVFPSPVHGSPEQRELKHRWCVGNTWHSETIAASIDPEYIGDRVAVAVGSDGVVHVAFTISNSLTSELHYARGDGSSWQSETVEASHGSMSIAVDGAGVPHILHLAGYPSNEVRYLTREPGGWMGETIGSTSYSNWGSALQLQADKVHAVFMDSNGLQTMAVGDGEGWAVDVVGHGTYSSLAIDAEGTPHVAYVHWSAGYSLVHAWLTESGWTDETLADETSLFGAPASPGVTLLPDAPTLTQDAAGRVRLAFGLESYKGAKYGKSLIVAFLNDGAWAPFVAGKGLTGFMNSSAVDPAGIVHLASVRAVSNDPQTMSVHEYSLRGFKLSLAVVPKGSGTIDVAPLDVETAGKTSVSIFPWDTVSLTATAAEGFEFAGWSGAISAADPAVELMMDHSTKAIARFVPTEP